jgi:hypothetical protein
MDENYIQPLQKVELFTTEERRTDLGKKFRYHKQQAQVQLHVHFQKELGQLL